MSPARAVRLYTAAAFFFCMVMSGLFMGAGGLGLAGSAGLLGLAWLPMLAWPAMQAVRRPAPALFAVFVAWAVLSLAWSPYDRPDQAIKLALLTPLFMLVPFGIARLDPGRRRRFAAFTAVIIALTAMFFAVEAVLDAPMSQWAKVSQGVPAGPDARALALRTLSRGASAFILVAGPVAVWLWLQGRRIPAGALGVVALLAALGYDVDANIAALVAGLVAGAAALARPRLTLPALCYAAAFILLLTPVLLGAALALTPDAVAESLPLSWHQRLEIWRYGLNQLSTAPVFGLGLDASRMMEDEMMLRGERLDLVPLHPHNGGLHVWLETGAVGAGLGVAALAALGRTLARTPPSAPVAAGIAFSATAWFVLTTLGYGVWQEWHHGALSLALAAAVFSTPDPRPV